MLATGWPPAHSVRRAALGLVTVAVLLAALIVWRRARDAACGTVRTVNGSSVEVVPSAGSVPCAEATQVLREYYGRVQFESRAPGDSSPSADGSASARLRPKRRRRGGSRTAPTAHGGS